MKIFFFLLPAFLPFVILSQTKPKAVTDGYSLVRTMHDKYAGKWYKNFTFVQDISFYKDGTEVKKEKWYEALSFPGNLTIKFNSMDSANGIVFSNFKVTSVKNGKALAPKPFIHDLLLAGFDVYFLKPETTAHLLDSLGYDLKIIHEDSFNGRKVYVTGAASGDTLSNQIWIDAERFYLHRIIYKRGKAVQDVTFGDYKQMNAYWVATSVRFTVNGQLEAMETYYDIKFPARLNPEIFDPQKFGQTKW